MSYSLCGPAGACALQRVETKVRFRRGEEDRVVYEGLYWEFFRLGAAPPVDVHSFSPRRDGWDVGFVRRLLQRYGLRAHGGSARLEVCKRFLLGSGRVEGEGHDGPFGYLAQGPGSHSSARLILQGSGGERRTLEPSPLPADEVPSGRGEWVGAAGWTVTESFSLSPAGGAARFDDGGGYAPVDLAQAPLSPLQFLI